MKKLSDNSIGSNTAHIDNRSYCFSNNHFVESNISGDQKEVNIYRQSSHDTWSLGTLKYNHDNNFAMNFNMVRMRIYYDTPAPATDTIYGAFIKYNGGTELLCFLTSVDDGENWVEDDAIFGDDAFDINAGYNIKDCFRLNDITYAMHCNRTAGSVHFYDEDHALAATIAVAADLSWSPGYVFDDEYYFMLGHANWTRLYKFTGAAIVLVEEITNSNLISGIFNQVNKRGNSIIFLGDRGGGSQVMAIKQLGTWTILDDANGKAEFPNISWDDNNSYEPKYIHTYDGSNYFTYYVYPAGYIQLIYKGVDERSFGWGEIFEHRSLSFTTYIPATEQLNISLNRLTEDRLTLQHLGSTWAEGQGVIFANNSSVVEFGGTPDPQSSYENDHNKIQIIQMVSPAKFSLKRLIDVDTEGIAVAVETILSNVIASDPYFLEVTFDATGVSIIYKQTQITVRQFLKDMEAFGLKVFHWEWDGNSYFDDGDELAGITIDHTNTIKPKTRVKNRGANVNKIIVVGGTKTDGKLARGQATLLIATDVQVNMVPYVFPSLKTDDDCASMAADILSNITTSLKEVNISFKGDQVKPIPGKRMNVTYSPSSLGATNFIIESGTYDLLSSLSKNVKGFNGIRLSSDYEARLTESNQIRLSELGEQIFDELELLHGFEYYLTDTNSDIGGYELLEESYSDAAEQSWTAAGAADDDPLEEFITPLGGLGTTLLGTGRYNCHAHFEKTGGTKDAQVYFKLYSRTAGGAETLLTTSDPTEIITSKTGYHFHAHVNTEVVIAATTRLVWKLFVTVTGNGTAPTIVLYAQTGNESHFSVPGIPANTVFVRKTVYEEFLAIGSGNLQDFQCVYEGTSQPGKMLVSTGLENVDDTDQAWQYKCVASPVRSDGKSLHVTGVKVRLVDADDDDYIDTIFLYFQDATADLQDSWDNGAANYKAAQIGLISESCGATRDAVNHESVTIYITLVCTNAQDVSIRSVLVTGYYA